MTIKALPWLLLLSLSGQATDLDTVKSNIQTKLTKTQIKTVKESPIADLYQVVLGNDQLIYYSPDADVMVFGEMYTLTGENLTASAKQTIVSESLIEHRAEALMIGPSDGVEIVEFTDPNCGYCAQLHGYLNTQPVPVKRLVFFETRKQPDSDQKAIHILCSEDKEKAFHEVYSANPPVHLASCVEGAKQLAAHANLSSRVGVSGTPTVFLDGKPMTGFRQSVIENYLKTSSARSTSYE